MRAGIEKVLASRSTQRVLKWFGHVEIMDKYRMTRSLLMEEVSGARVRGLMDGMMVALGSRRMTVELRDNKDRNEWRALVHM